MLFLSSPKQRFRLNKSNRKGNVSATLSDLGEGVGNQTTALCLPLSAMGSSQMTQKELMLAGRYYTALSDQQLNDEADACIDLCEKLNAAKGQQAL